MESIPSRKHIRLTPTEKTMVVSAHQWLSSYNILQEACQRLELCMCVALYLVILECKIDGVLTE